MAEIVVVIGLIISILTIIEKVINITNSLKKPKTKRRRKRK
ncbi:hypothetical protein ACPJHQ_26090 [Rossellomorea sp. H39__3]